MKKEISPALIAVVVVALLAIGVFLFLRIGGTGAVEESQIKSPPPPGGSFPAPGGGAAAPGGQPAQQPGTPPANIPGPGDF